MIADAFLRAPLFSPEEVEDINIDMARVCLAKSSSYNQLDVIFDAIDADYVKLRQDVRNGSFQSVYANQLKYFMPQLSADKDLVYLDGARIILPKNAVLPLLHVSHIGINKTYELCRSLYFWPGMFNKGKQVIVFLAWHV